VQQERIKSIIKIIQDYCFNYSTGYLASEFTLSIASKIENCIVLKNLNINKLNQITRKRDDFYKANDIDFYVFNKGLFKKLNYELSFYNYDTFFDILKIFKQKMENGNARPFKKENTSEDHLRCILNVYLDKETFCESCTSSGNSDIIIPSEKAVIETKLWRGIENYNAGLLELNDYLDKTGYSDGYFIIFDYLKNSNDIIKQKGEIFIDKFKNREIYIIFIMMNTIRPSKIYKESKKKLYA